MPARTSINAPGRVDPTMTGGPHDRSMSTTCVAPRAAYRSRTPHPGGPPSASDDDPAAAVVAFQAGDTGALALLMARYGRMMAAVARRYLRSGHDIEDAVQDAWLSFARSASGIEKPTAIGGWLSVTTARAALSIAERQARLSPAGLDRATGAETGRAADEEEAVDEADVHAVRDAVGRLSPRDRELISLLFASELSYAEIGARIGRPQGWIGPTRQRVISKLRRDHAIRQIMLAEAA